jgi:hypothetical protein
MEDKRVGAFSNLNSLRPGAAPEEKAQGPQAVPRLGIRFAANPLEALREHCADLVAEAAVSVSRQEGSRAERAMYDLAAFIRKIEVPEMKALQVWEENLRYLLEEALPKECVVRVCEGGGPEDMLMSLAVSVHKMNSRYEALVAHAQNALHALRCIEADGFDNGRIVVETYPDLKEARE